MSGTGDASARPLRSTYRLQLGPSFGFDAVREILPYLIELGVRDLYLSPIAEAVPGSPHGYDVVDPTQVRSELGGRAAFSRLAAAAREAGLGVLLDIVPNHVAAHAANPWWWDVLKHGPRSERVRCFDIDWAAGGDRLVLPVLDRLLADAIARGDVTLGRGSPHDPGEPVLRFFDRVFPVAPGSLDDGSAGPGAADLADLAAVAAVAARQHYRLEPWRSGLARINYRRFFDIADLAALRVEDEVVFEASHRLLEELVAAGEVTAVRVDHVDGLRDPGVYLRRLAELLEKARGRSGLAGTVPVLVEKILAADETLPEEWPVAGTTGYEFLNRVNRLFADPGGAARIESHARSLGAIPGSAGPQAAKREVIDTLFGAEIERLVALLRQAAGGTGVTVPDDATLRSALVACTVALPVYRTYVDQGPVRPTDRALLTAALDACDGGRAGVACLRHVIRTAEEEGRATVAARDFMMSWQQLTGAVMAKGVEDTALYRHVGLVALNEVGGEPGADAGDRDAATALDALGAERARRWPMSLNATDTHDAKRGEDTRARLDALSEIADEWIAAVDRWRETHAPLRQAASGAETPSAADELLLYQSLAGIWPPGAAEPGPDAAGRLEAYLVKAAREAKLSTSWHDPRADYEDGLRRFVQSVVAGAGGAASRRELRSLLDRLELIGAVNSLAQLAVKMTFPGVPDLYQGAESWKLSLVDPDNRRPVDFQGLRETLRRATPTLAWACKLHVTARLLALRAAMPELLARGDFTAVRARGAHAGRVYAFERRLGDRRLLAVVPRLVAPLAAGGRVPLGAAWQDTVLTLPDSAAPRAGAWTEWITARPVPGRADAAVPLADVFATLPVAVLVNADSDPGT